MTHRLRLTASTAAALILIGACGSDTSPSGSDSAKATESDSSGGRPTIVDYSPTLSDVPALMFLATHPDVDLLAVTLPGTGEADCEPGVRQTRALLAIAGRPDTPVGCGRDEPMEGNRDWPDEWRAASNSLTGVLLPGVVPADPIDAEELLARTLRDADEPVDIVTLAPLTNLGRVLRDDPSLRDQIHSVVTMGGAFEVAGNVDAAPSAEWNLYIDPESVRAVLESGVPITFVGLDATLWVPGSAATYARLQTSATTDAGESVRQLWSANLPLITSDGWFFWDELAAVISVEPSVATISTHRLTVDDDGATVVDEAGSPARVATAADPAAFERIFLELFAGGTLTMVELSTAEAEYLDQVGAAMAAFDTTMGEVFGELEARIGDAPGDEVMGDFAETIFVGLTGMRAALLAAEPPTAYEIHHQDLIDVLAPMIDGEAAFLASIDSNVSSDPITGERFWELFELAAEDAGIEEAFDGFDEACTRLESVAFAHGAAAGICVNG